MTTDKPGPDRLQNFLAKAKMKSQHSSKHPRPMKSGSLALFAVLVTCCFWGTQSTAHPNCCKESDGSQETALKDPDLLRPGEVVSRSIKGGEGHAFAISLVAGQFLNLHIEQHGSVLLATLFDPQGKAVIEMDYPAGGFGPIDLSTIALLSGDYRLEIRSINKWANVAGYELTLEEIRGADAADQSQIDAEMLFAAGGESSRADNAAAALVYYDQARSSWIALKNYRWQALTEYALSRTHFTLGNPKKSEECLDATLRILQIEMSPNDWRLKASALNDLGPIYTSARLTEKALGVLNEALSLYAANQDRRGQASALTNLAITHGREGDLFLARDLAEKALTLRKAENDLPGAIGVLNILGTISDRLGEPDQALDYSTQALRGWEELGEIAPNEGPRVAAVLNNVAAASDKLGKWDQALIYYDRALEKYKETDPRRAPVLDNKGELYLALGNPAKARECYDEALKLLATGEPDLDIKAGLLVHMGQLLLVAGDVPTAISYFEQARSIGPHQPKLADVLTNLGAAFALKGDLEKAIEAYQRALEIQLKLLDQRGQALTLQKLGEAQVGLGMKTEALDDLKRALVFWKALKDQRGEAATYDDIARVERERGNLAAALANSDEAIAIIESQRTNISSHLLRTSYFATQKNYYEIAVDLKMQLVKPKGGKENLIAALELSEKARARVLLDALSEAGVGRREFNQSSDPRLAGLIEQRLNLLAKLGAKAQARTKLLNGQHSSEQVAAIDKEITAVTEQYDELEAKLRSHSPRFASLTKPLPSTLKEIQQQLDENTLLLEYALGDKRSYAWVVSRDSIDGFKLAAGDQIESMARRVIEAVTARNREEKNETWAEKRLRFDKAEKDFAEASATLSRMVLEPVASLLGQKRLVVVADGALQLVPFAALPTPANAANAGTSTATASPANVEKPTTSAKSSNIAGVAPMPLIAQHEIITLPSASVLALQRRELANRKPAPLAVAVIADPVFDLEDARVARASGNSNQNRKNAAAPRQAGTALSKQSAPTSSAPPSSHVAQSSPTHSGSAKEEFLANALRDVGVGQDGKLGRLGQSRQEAINISRVVSPNAFLSALDFKASRQTAMSPELSQYRIIHFATHGVLDLEHPELSGIVLSMVDEKGQPQDGYLRLNDIYNLNLPAELVVLSACETGVGKQVKGEGLIALTRGFMYAGAKSVVASLWKVDDAATSALMAEFYRQMFTNKLKPAAALRAAQLKVSQERRWSSPYYWAGFFLQGDWN